MWCMKCGQRVFVCLLVVVEMGLAQAQTLDMQRIPKQVLGGQKIADVVFSPDGMNLAVACASSLVRIIRSDTGSSVKVFAGTTGAMTSIAYSPDGARVLTGGQTIQSDGAKVGQAVLWDVATGSVVRTFTVGDRVNDVAFFENGEKILTCNHHKQSVHTDPVGTISIWDAASGVLLNTLMHEDKHEVKHVSFSADGARFATVCESAVRVWDTAALAPMATITPPDRPAEYDAFKSVISAAMTPDGTHVYVSSTYNHQGYSSTWDVQKTTIWDAATGVQAEKTFYGADSILFTPDGAKVIFDGHTCADIQQRIYYGTLPLSDRLLENHEKTVSDVVSAISPDGQRSVTAFNLVETTSGYRSLLANTAIVDVFGMASFARHPAVPIVDEGVYIAFAPDSTTAAVAVYKESETQMQVFQCNTETGAPGASFTVDIASGYNTDTARILYSADGTKVFTVFGKQVDLWNAQTGAHLRTFDNAVRAQTAVYSPDGTIVGVGGWSNTGVCQLWNTTTGEALPALDQTDSVQLMHFSNDNRTLVTVHTEGDYGGTRSCTLRFLNVQTGALIRTLALPGLEAMDFNGDLSRALCLQQPDQQYAAIVSTVTGAEVQRFDPPGVGYFYGSEDIMFSGDSSRALIGGFDDVYIWDVASGTLLNRFDYQNRVGCWALSPDGARIALACGTGADDPYALVSYDAAPNPLLMQREQAAETLSRGAFSPDGSRVAGVSSYTMFGYNVWLWDAHGEVAERKISDLTWQGSAVACSRDGASVLTGQLNGTVQLWEVATGAELRAFEGHNGAIRGAVYSPDGIHVLTGSEDGTAKLWNVNTGAVAADCTANEDAVMSVAISPDGARIGTGALNNTAKIFDAQTGDEVYSFNPAHPYGEVRSVAFTADGKRFLAGCSTGNIVVYDAGTGGELQTLNGDSPVLSLAAAPDGWHVFAGLKNGQAVVWDMLTGAVVSAFGPVMGASGCDSLDLSRDGAQVLLAGYDDSKGLVFDSGLPPANRHARDIALDESVESDVYSLEYSDFRLKLRIGAAPNVVVRMTPAGDSGNWTLVGRRGGFPTLVDYDWRGVLKSDGTMEMLIPAPGSNSLYLSVFYSYWAKAYQGHFTLQCLSMNRYLADISHHTGGNAGSTTVSLSGLGFETGMRVELRSGAGAVLRTFTPSSFDLSALRVALDLTGLPPQVVNVAVVWPDNEALLLPQAFEIVAGAPAQLTTTLDVPAYARGKRPFSLWFGFENIGLADKAAPVFTITSRDTMPMRLSQNEPWSTNPIQVLGLTPDENGTGVSTCEPGARQRIPIQVLGNGHAHQKLDFDVSVESDPETVIDWDAHEANMRPANVEDALWTRIWPLLKQNFGTTWGEYVAQLRKNAEYLSSQGALYWSVPQLTLYEMRKIIGLSVRPCLARAVDAYCPEKGLPLAFTRVYRGQMGDRLNLGPLGYGWTHSLNIFLEVSDDGGVTLQDGSGAQRFFQKKDDGAYVALNAGDRGHFVEEGGAYHLTEVNGNEYVFRTDLKLATLTDVRGNRLTAQYDQGRLVAMQHSSGDRFQLEYNTAGRIKQLTDQAGRTTTFAYDTANEHLLSVTDAAGRVVQYSYNGDAGSPADHALRGTVHPDGSAGHFDYDAYGRLAADYSDGTANRRAYSYDEDGRVSITFGDDSAPAVVLSPDATNRVVRVQKPDGPVVTLEYDWSDGHLARVTDGLGHVSEHQQDIAESVIRDPLGNETTLQMKSGIGMPKALVDAKGNALQFEYNEQRRLQRATFADGTYENFNYDDHGQLTRYTNRKGETFYFEFNSHGQMTRKAYPDGREVTCTYTAARQLASVTDASGTISITYDARNFPVRIDYPGGMWFAYEYNDAGLRTRRSGSDGVVLNYQYDAQGRLMRLVQEGVGDLAGYEYDADGRLSRETRGNGTYTEYAYDAVGHIMSMVNYSGAGGVQSRFDYAYDAAERVISMNTVDGTRLYDYDAAGRLTEVTYPDGHTQSFIYDAAGNRLSSTGGALPETYGVGVLNQCLQAGDATFTYDANGNRASRTDGSGTTDYQYNYDNRLVRVEASAGDVWEYTYNALGQRTSITHNGETKRFAPGLEGWGGGIAEFDGSGNLVASNVIGYGLVARINGSGAAEYYAFDADGNTVQLTDATGAVIAEYQYDPFGQVLSSSKQGTGTPYQAGGQGGSTSDGSGTVYNGQTHTDTQTNQTLTPTPGQGTQGDYHPPKSLSKFKAADVQALGEYIIGYLGNFAPDGSVANNAAGYFTSVTGGIAAAFAEDDARKTPDPYDDWRADVNWGLWGGGLIAFTIGAPTPVGATLFVLGTTKVIADKLTDDYVASLRDADWYKPVPRNPWATDPLLKAGKNMLIPHDDPIWEYLGDPEILFPDDPNEKTGVPGTGAEHWVPRGEVLTYSIFFENKSSASAPAQEVIVTDYLSEYLDWSTFRLTDIQWGSYSVEVPADAGVLSTRETIADYRVDVSKAWWVDVTATMNSVNGKVEWRFRTLDPDTGELPEDALAGLLPPNDATHRGEGHVSFTILPRADAPEAARIVNSASIVFDQNAAIETNEVFNTLGVPPEGEQEGQLEGQPEGEGDDEGQQEGEGVIEGEEEGVPVEGEVEGQEEGQAEGTVEGEGEGEGEPDNDCGCAGNKAAPGSLAGVAPGDLLLTLSGALALIMASRKKRKE